MLRVAHLLELLARAVAVVGLALLEESRDDFAVAVEALGLVVRPLVVVELQPGDTVEDACTAASVERSRSVSSMRRTVVPSACRAHSQE
jgi:hypothetical protein